MAIAVMCLPLITLYVLVKVLPPWLEARREVAAEAKQESG